jgi:outer membrane protein assembly factor BamB
MLLVAAIVALSAQQQSAEPSKANFERLCGTCHEPERSTASRRTREQWLQTVNSMVARGAEGTDEELLAVVEYLTREHGRVNVNLASAADLALVLGLTPAESAAIVRYRGEHGAFDDPAGVERVPGVDPKKVAARRDAMVFGSRVASKAGRVPVPALTAANNWPTLNGSPQRDAWARAEAMLSRSTVGTVQLIYTRKLENQNRGPLALTPPLVLGNLISYRGFKEMLFVGGSADVVYSVDAVLNRVLWRTQLPIAAGAVPNGSATCPGGLIGIVMPGAANAAVAGVAGIRRPGAAPPGAVSQPPSPRSALITGLAGGFGRNGLLLAVGSDGNVRPLYQSNGATFGEPIAFVPAGSSVGRLNLYDNVLYASTSDNCGGPNAVYALDLASDKPVVKFETGSAGIGTAGPAIGSDGTVYAQLADGRGEAGEYRDTLVALGPRDLELKDFFTPASSEAGAAGGTRGISPVVFRWNGRDVIVAGSRDGRLFVLDSSTLGGSDHRTPLAQIESIGPTRGAFASWEDPDAGMRWIYAPIWGAPRNAATFAVNSGKVSRGAVAAFTVETRDGKTALVPRWLSRDMNAPMVAVANGLVFAVSSAEGPNRAALYILDASTGRQLFSSGDAITSSPGPGARGLAIANGRVYFTTEDNTVYCFGIPTEH